MKAPLTQSTRYRNFITARDQMLERILLNTKIDTSRILHDALERFVQIVHHRYGRIESESSHFTMGGRRELHILDQQFDAVIQSASQRIASRIMRMRRDVTTLTVTGEAEAIAQAQGKPNSVKVSPHHLDQAMFAPMTQGESLLDRVTLALSRIKRDVMDAVETSRVLQLGLSEAVNKVIAALPSSYRVKQPPKVLRRVKESERDPADNVLSVSLIDDEDWNAMIVGADNPLEELPWTRFYNEPIYVGGVPEGEVLYSWEIENSLTQDFVEQVRSGQSDAAKQAGIEDFVWVAVLDDRTDECCQWRDGLTTTEIRAELSGKHQDDDCQAEVPSAHFNCRCFLAPVGDLPERIESNEEEFQDWLNS